MLLMNIDHHIVINNCSDEWDLEDSESYAEFLIWITTPLEDPMITKEVFELAPSINEEDRPRAERYAEFLKEFVDKRNALLKKHEEEHVNFENFTRAIDEFISSLSSDE